MAISIQELRQESQRQEAQRLEALKRHELQSRTAIRPGRFPWQTSGTPIEAAGELGGVSRFARYLYDR